MRRTGFGWAGIVLTAFALSACHQNGTVYAVDVTTDSVDANPGDGICADSDGHCSVRAAVMEANAVPGVEEIRLLSATTHFLTIDGGSEDSAATGDLDLNEAVVITGGGTIDATAIPDRAIHVRHTAGLTELVDIELAGTASLPGSIQDGSVLLHDGTGLLLIDRGDLRGFAHPLGSAVSLRGPSLVRSTSIRADPVDRGMFGALTVDGPNHVNLRNVTVSGTPAPDGTPNVAVLVFGDDAIVDVRHATILGEWVGRATISGSILDTCRTQQIYMFELPVSGGRNVESGTSCGFARADDQQNTDPLLGALTDNGGSVLTALPQPGSAVLDTGPCALTVDARDFARPSGTSCDSGAVEVQPGE